MLTFATSLSYNKIQNTTLIVADTADTDKTKLSCLVRVGGVNTIIGDKTRQCIDPVSNLSFVLSPIVFTPPTQTRQDSSVSSVSAV